MSSSEPGRGARPLVRVCVDGGTMIEDEQRTVIFAIGCTGASIAILASSTIIYTYFRFKVRRHKRVRLRLRVVCVDVRV